MKNLIKKVVFLMALGCVEQTSCDWLSTWNAFKDDAGSKWHEFKGKVEDTWHNLKSDYEKYEGTDYKAIDYGYARESKAYMGGGEYYEDYGIGEKYWENDFKNFLHDPEQKTLGLISNTGKHISFHKTSINDGIAIYCDGEKLVDFYNYLEYPLKGEFSNRILIKELLTKGALSPREVFTFLISLGVNVTDDFDRFLHSVNDVAKAPGDNKFCVFKNTDGEFIMFYINKNHYGDYEFCFGSTSENNKNYRKTDNGSQGHVYIYGYFKINQTEKLEKYFTEEQLTKIRNTLKDSQDSLDFRNVEMRNAKRLHGIS